MLKLWTQLCISSLSNRHLKYPLTCSTITQYLREMIIRNGELPFEKIQFVEEAQLTIDMSCMCLLREKEKEKNDKQAY